MDEYKELIEVCEGCGTEFKSKFRKCPTCGFNRFQNPDDQTNLKGINYDE